MKQKKYYVFYKNNKKIDDGNRKNRTLKIPESKEKLIEYKIFYCNKIHYVI